VNGYAVGYAVGYALLCQKTASTDATLLLFEGQSAKNRAIRTPYCTQKTAVQTPLLQAN